MIHKEIIQNRRGLPLSVLVETPENPKGLAFVMHGLGGFKEQVHIQAIADVFLGEGYTTVRFDATHANGESGGRYEDATMEGYYQDLDFVVSWAATQPWYQKPFFLAGHSLGGYSVLQYAENYAPELVKGVFSFAPVVSGKYSHEAANQFFPEETKNWKETGWKTRISESKPGVVMRLPWSHMEERLKHDLLRDASKLTMPILIVVGDEDKSCTPESQQVLYDAIPGKKQLVIVPGAPHTFREPEHLAQLKEAVSSWLKEQV